MSVDNLLAPLSANELSLLMRQGEVSPVEILSSCISRIERLNPAVNAITATSYERARAEAREAERHLRRGDPIGPLHGLPIGIKDLQETKDLLTTYGSPRFRDHVPTADQPLVASLRQAGAIVVGKTNVPEMGAGANTRNPVWGATGNPFDPMLNAGGSSGGSAAALALDMLPLCTGSDTGGSLRIPAALCGVVGFRPSPDLVPHATRPLGWSSISLLGPMARNVGDICLLLRAMVGCDSRDPLSGKNDPAIFDTSAPPDLRALRVGYTEDFGVCAVDSGIRKVFRERMETIAPLFGDCRPLDFDLSEADRCFDIIRAESFVAAFHDDYRRNPALLAPDVRVNYEIGSSMTLADRAWAHAEQTRLFRSFQQTIADVDVVLAPVSPVTPFGWQQPYADRIDGMTLSPYYRWLALTYVVTLANNPVLSMPCGIDHAGMPFGIQVIGKFRGDAQLLQAAQAIELGFESIPTTRRPKPDLARLSEPTPELKSIVTAPPGSNDGHSATSASVPV
ncbi:amidase family protein [Halomonas sp. LR3S48]|uniref:amidase n=1 Tax=Halomonas sp. LR3S48 TaxID=2982694 RepID=UPI0021E4D7D2|nr:amidase family protein [Halomonas sp. LR3S48]UYG01789.1 amidase family protein [Halomonas sp. LR3S48]